MTKFNKKPCPLCEQEAEWIMLDFERKMKFNCPKCKVFSISTHSEEAIINSPKSKKDALSNKSAQCGKNAMLHIYIENNEIITECILKNS
jgi:hypothetical protein